VQPALQFPIASQLHEYHLVEGEAHKVERLRYRSRSSIVDICHGALRRAVSAGNAVVVRVIALP
jgi:hypothetical protein